MRDLRKKNDELFCFADSHIFIHLAKIDQHYSSYLIDFSTAFDRYKEKKFKWIISISHHHMSHDAVEF